jgi:hypothetical protein
VDTILGPEMKSTGEVMGVGETFAEAFVKSQIAAGERLPNRGKVFISGARRRQGALVEIARVLRPAGLHAGGHPRHGGGARGGGLEVTRQQGAEGRPHIVDMIKNGEMTLIINTVEEKRSHPGFVFDPPRGAAEPRHATTPRSPAPAPPPTAWLRRAHCRSTRCRIAARVYGLQTAEGHP